MDISLLSSVDDSTYRFRKKVIPLAVDSLKDTNYIEYVHRESVLSRVRSKGCCSSGEFLPDEHIVMAVSLDPKKCKVPREYCRAECRGCNYNPLTGLLDHYSTESPFVIASRDTIDLLLDCIVLLAKANKNAIRQGKCSSELILNDFTDM
jgi:hypothetical protein